MFINQIYKNKIPLFLPAICFIGIVALWEILIIQFQTPLYIMPPPSKIVLAFVSDWRVLAAHAYVTIKETLLGIAIALLAAMVLAIMMDAFKWFRAVLYPVLVVSQTIPVIVLAPIFIIYLGFGIAPKVITVVLMCFFPIAVNFADGLKNVDSAIVGLVQSYGAKPYQTYWIVKIPAAASSLFSGLKVAATYSISGAVVGEWLSSNSGLGYYMLRVKNGYHLDKVFACVLMIVLLSLAMNALVAVLAYAAMPNNRNRNKINHSKI